MNTHSSGARAIIQLPIFPLPNSVLFPQTLLPLHIFEPRYRQMVGDALDSDGKIGISLLQPGGEGVTGSEVIYPVGGMGIITESEKLDDDHFNILLAGRKRYRVIETVSASPYRVDRVQLIEDVQPNSQEASRLGRQLIEAFRRLFRAQPENAQSLEVLDKLDFPTLVNSICSSLNISPLDKQRLMEMDRIQERAETILGVVQLKVEQMEWMGQFTHLRPEDPRVN